MKLFHMEAFAVMAVEYMHEDTPSVSTLGFWPTREEAQKAADEYEKARLEQHYATEASWSRIWRAAHREPPTPVPYRYAVIPCRSLDVDGRWPFMSLEEILERAALVQTVLEAAK